MAAAPGRPAEPTNQPTVPLTICVCCSVLTLSALIQRGRSKGSRIWFKGAETAVAAPCDSIVMSEYCENPSILYNLLFNLGTSLFFLQSLQSRSPPLAGPCNCTSYAEGRLISSSFTLFSPAATCPSAGARPYVTVCWVGRPEGGTGRGAVPPLSQRNRGRPT